MVESIPLEAIGPKEAVKPDATDKEKKAFFKAIKAKNFHKIKKFSKKYNLNFCFEEYTPLILALKKLNTFDVVKDLIENGAKVTNKDKDGWAPLHVAINNECSLDIIKLLIEHKADIINEVARYTCDLPEYTPLSVSIMKNNFEVFKFLFDKNADMTKANSDGTTALTLAQRNKRTVILNYYYGPLGYAIFSENLVEARRLLEGGADVFTTGANKKTPLVIAIEKSSLKATKFLFKFGASFTLSQSVFLKAVDVGNLEIINFFIQHKVRKYQIETSPLVKAIEKGNFEMVKILIENNADLKLPNDIHLLKAVETGNYEIVKLLIEKSASVNSTDLTKITLDDDEVCTNVKLPNNTLLLKAIEKGDLNIVKFLIEKGASVNSTDLAKIILDDYELCTNVKLPNNTLLLKAIEKGDLNMVKFLIEKGASVNSTDLAKIILGDYEPSTLQKVVETKNALFIKYLLDHGLPLNSDDKTTKSLLAIAAENCSYVIAGLLIDAGADINSAEEELKKCAELNNEFKEYYQGVKQELSKKSSAEGDGHHE